MAGYEDTMAAPHGGGHGGRHGEQAGERVATSSWRCVVTVVETWCVTLKTSTVAVNNMRFTAGARQR